MTSSPLLDRARLRARDLPLSPPAPSLPTLEEYQAGFARRFGASSVSLEAVSHEMRLLLVDGLVFRETGYPHAGKAFKGAPYLRQLWVLSVMEVPGNPDRPLRPRGDAVNDLDDLARLVAREPGLVFDADAVLALLANRVKVRTTPTRIEGYYRF